MYEQAQVKTEIHERKQLKTEIVETFSVEISISLRLALRGQRLRGSEQEAFDWWGRRERLGRSFGLWNLVKLHKENCLPLETAEEFPNSMEAKK